MYKYLLYLFALLFSFNLSAQEEFTDFMVNDQYGVVDTKNLEELVTPAYTKKIYFSDDYLVFDNTDSVDMYHKNTGVKTQFTIAEAHYQLFVKTAHFLHILSNSHKSALLGENGKVAITFAYRYNTINNFLWSPYIIANAVHGYDIYNAEQSFKLLHKQIKAKDYFISDFKKMNKNLENCIVFYGKGTVNLYDQKFQLLKTITSKATTEDQAIAALKPFYTAGNEPGDIGSAPVAAEINWYVVKRENGYKIFENQQFSSIYLKVNNRFDVENSNYDDVKVYDGSKGIAFIFKLNGTEKKALIPLKYQQLMELEVIDRN